MTVTEIRSLHRRGVVECDQYTALGGEHLSPPLASDARGAARKPSCTNPSMSFGHRVTQCGLRSRRLGTYEKGRERQPEDGGSGFYRYPLRPGEATWVSSPSPAEFSTAPTSADVHSFICMWRRRLSQLDIMKVSGGPKTPLTWDYASCSLVWSEAGHREWEPDSDSAIAQCEACRRSMQWRSRCGGRDDSMRSINATARSRDLPMSCRYKGGLAFQCDSARHRQAE